MWIVSLKHHLKHCISLASSGSTLVWKFGFPLLALSFAVFMWSWSATFAPVPASFQVCCPVQIVLRSASGICMFRDCRGFLILSSISSHETDRLYNHAIYFPPLERHHLFPATGTTSRSRWYPSLRDVCEYFKTSHSFVLEGIEIKRDKHSVCGVCSDCPAS